MDQNVRRLSVNQCCDDVAAGHDAGVGVYRPVLSDRHVDGAFDHGAERGVAPGGAPGKAEVAALARRGAAALIPEVGAAGEVECMYFDTRAKPAGFNRQLRERVAEVHLRVDRRQRVFPRRWQHLEEGAVAIVVAVAVAGRPQVARAQPRPVRRARPAMPRFDRDAGGAMRAAVPVAGLQLPPRRRDRTRRSAVGNTRAYEPPTVAIVTSTGRSNEKVLSTTAISPRRSRYQYPNPCHSTLPLFSVNDAGRDLHFRHRQVGRLLESALRRHERRDG